MVWRGVLPPGSAKTLASYVSRLRTALSLDAGIAARGSGYSRVRPPTRLGSTLAPVSAIRQACGRTLDKIPPPVGGLRECAAAS